ncbi:MAG: methyltransferase type 11 [Alphaproteobacteria bacterium]|jgi:SAM-dependent methyltransferase|nr:methyltransferase type 11 [Alphaproteobacteria bacterium]MDF3033539.1 methyltransferase type 11 [Alphaproteobacteria bacterium]
MTYDVINFCEFYSTPLGQAAGHQIQSCIRQIWPDLTGQTILGLGYPLPYLDFYLKPSECVFAFMPAQQGVVLWPDIGLPRIALTEEGSLPLPDQSVDRILMIHTLEHTEQPRQLLREAWRILTGQGRLLIIVPNRRSMWAHLDSTPFGHGQPYTMTQITTLLKSNLFTPVATKRALYMVPSQSRLMMACTPFLDKIGNQVLQKFSGIVCVEAMKQVYAGTPIRTRKHAPAPSLVGV